MRTVRLVVWALVGLALVAMGLIAWQAAQRAGDDQALYDEAVETIGGPFELVRSDTLETVTDADFADKPKAIFFGFTFCPDVCPTTLFELANHLEALGENADNIHALMVTIDPERDTAEFLQDYVGAFSDRIVGLTGSQEAIDEVVANFRVYARRVELDDGDYTMDHTASIFLMNTDNELVGTIAYQENPDTALQKLQRLAQSEG
ncbi:MAG: SCO family protein [Pseudomonadota bacterium]